MLTFRFEPATFPFFPITTEALNIINQFITIPEKITYYDVIITVLGYFNPNLKEKKNYWYAFASEQVYQQ